MAVPYDQELRHDRFIRAHPQWSIHAEDEAATSPPERRRRDAALVANVSEDLLDRLDESRPADEAAPDLAAPRPPLNGSPSTRYRRSPGG